MTLENNGLLSVIIPSMNEEGNIEAICAELTSVLGGADIPFELIFVDDGSRDRTWELICRVCETGGGRCRGVRLSRNFGKEGAMFAGLESARGDCAAVIDADLQFPPETLAEMWRVWRAGGADVVQGKKRSRGKEGLVYKLFTKCFYGLLRTMSGIDLSTGSDFMLLDRCALNALKLLPEKQTFYRAMPGWVGFSRAEVQFDVRDRVAGKTKFSPKKLVKFALNNLAAFSSSPLQIVTGFGVFFLLAALGLGIGALCAGGPLTKATLGVMAVCALTGGVVMLALGVCGFYMARIYEELKGRPRYIIWETR